MTCKVQVRTPSALPSPCSGGLQAAGGHGSHRGDQDCRPLPLLVTPGVTAGAIGTLVLGYVAGLGVLAPRGQHPKR